MAGKVDLKVVLLGKEFGGKTSLVERYIHGKFNAQAPYQSVSEGEWARSGREGRQKKDPGFVYNYIYIRTGTRLSKAAGVEGHQLEYRWTWFVEVTPPVIACSLIEASGKEI